MIGATTKIVTVMRTLVAVCAVAEAAAIAPELAELFASAFKELA